MNGWEERLHVDEPLILPSDEQLSKPLDRIERRPTPVDAFGRVVVADLVKMMRGLVQPGYNWASPYADEHHLLWPNRYYDVLPMPLDVLNPQMFRNLASNRIIVPRRFHDLVHLATFPPDTPQPADMIDMVEAQEVVNGMRNAYVSTRDDVANRFMTVEDVRTRDYMAALELEQQLQEKMDNFAHLLGRAAAVPPQFQLVDVGEFELRSTEDLVRIARIVGRQAFPKKPVKIVIEDQVPIPELAEAA